ncbi:hypothetical protein [Blastococcus sp. TF02A-30]|uniref:hypothetical protein n=1 Tax=Blastococcus sp. TF02A-30 TaxID=2250580 RepID=UPI000DEB5138|nr:hypothetical protein [Blastococcus sp. TF02A-30]RBY89251.1 hypothetical protein DQ241_07120 [Blastococcus sp. TF02A-30]
MTSPDAAAEGRRRADEFLTLLAREDAAADALLADLADLRDLVFLGAGLTAIARAEGRALPTAQRAQASTRQINLAQLRDANRGDLDGLRTWLRRSGEEVLFIRSLHARAQQLSG